MAGGLLVAQYRGGYASAMTPAIVGWFLLFLVMALFIFGSLFIAIGAACNDLKDSQSMMTPVMLLVMMPVLTWRVRHAGARQHARDRAVARADGAPFLMLLRISLQPGPPDVADRALGPPDGRHRPRGRVAPAARSSARAC